MKLYIPVSGSFFKLLSCSIVAVCSAVMLASSISAKAVVPTDSLVQKEQSTLAWFYDDGAVSGVTWNSSAHNIEEASTADYRALKVSFNERGSSTLNGLVLHEVDGFKDLSEFYAGHIIFDLKVDAYNEATGDFLVGAYGADSEVLGINIGSPAVGEWSQYRVSISELVVRGLDLSNIGHPFQLSYTGESGNHFTAQVRSVRWQVIPE